MGTSRLRLINLQRPINILNTIMCMCASVMDSSSICEISFAPAVDRALDSSTQHVSILYRLLQLLAHFSGNAISS